MYLQIPRVKFPKIVPSSDMYLQVPREEALFEDTCLTFLIGGVSFFTCLRKIPCFSEYHIRKYFLWFLPWYALPSTNVEVRTSRRS